MKPELKWFEGKIESTADLGRTLAFVDGNRKEREKERDATLPEYLEALDTVIERYLETNASISLEQILEWGKKPKCALCQLVGFKDILRYEPNCDLCLYNLLMRKGRLRCSPGFEETTGLPACGRIKEAPVIPSVAADTHVRSIPKILKQGKERGEYLRDVIRPIVVSLLHTQALEAAVEVTLRVGDRIKVVGDTYIIGVGSDSNHICLINLATGARWDRDKKVGDIFRIPLSLMRELVGNRCCEILKHT
jgi:hypothetical protein